ncbi:TetR/AcrR family transcriptional regulator C-terminal domain-containing protein [Dactylosporangium sucinum]|uniref:GntR family transcriptional regulator n=1 Tax=Dactylosporangium sucinum TaxID=1424081 RepID=A0A917TP74_9ACTN|nr:TetR/AcrR family transcriptional regulator C-terminal domain-containing protein [Dactylosporangium sucinum]GGM31367.1 GntR family transcriptional regulator [Dactylosporangium sucinum]
MTAPDPEPPYRRIAAEIRRRIATGDLRPGDRVPSARQITRDWSVAVATATKALAALRQAGLTTVVAGVGTVVAGAPTARPTTPALSRAEIVTVATALADREGFQAVSLRRVATELGLATATVRRHIESEDTLILHMIDAAFASAPLPQPPPQGWRVRLELAGRRLWTLFRRHPWLAPALSLTRPQPSAHGAKYLEWVLTALDGTGLSLHDRMYVHLMLFGYIRGLATALEPEAQAERETGMTGNEWMDSGFGDARLPPDVPIFERLVAMEDFELDVDRLFDFGLSRLLDGLAVFVSRSRP